MITFSHNNVNESIKTTFSPMISLPHQNNSRDNSIIKPKRIWINLPINHFLLAFAQVKYNFTQECLNETFTHYYSKSEATSLTLFIYPLRRNIYDSETLVEAAHEKRTKTRCA